MPCVSKIFASTGQEQLAGTTLGFAASVQAMR
jgi:hypothetical protein